MLYGSHPHQERVPETHNENVLDEQYSFTEMR